MPSAAGQGGPGELDRFRRLVDFTILATFVLIVIGGVVRVSDSGLGCGEAGSGTKGWPLCGGRVLPFLQERAVVEFSHRIAATIVVVLIGLLVWRTVRRLRDRRWLVRGTIFAAVLVLGQAALGGLTVENNLYEALVAAHLGLAMLLLGTLIVLRQAARREAHETEPVANPGPLRTVAIVACVLVLGTIVAGGYVAGTEHEGRTSGPVGGAHLACGEEFPTCVGKFMPFGENRLVDIQLTHRAFMYLAAIAVLTMAALAWRRGVRSRAFPLAALLLLLQILLGALNVWLGKHPGLIAAHLTMATLLWGTVIYAATEVVPAREPRRSTVPPADSEASTVTA
jgi:heme A synthase